MKIINLEQGSQEWREFRHGKIGASDAAAIMGLNPYCTPLMKWEEKIKGVDKAPNEAMIRGSRLESQARDWYNQTHGTNFKPLVCEHDDRAWQIASLDGWDGERILEIKCPTKEIDLGELAIQYNPQIQHQMEVTGAKEAILLVYYESHQHIVNMARDETFIEEMVSAEKKFYESLLSFDPPEPQDADFVEETNELIIHFGETYAQLSSQIKFLQEQQEDLRTKLVSNAKHKRMKVGPVKLTQVMRKGNIDYKSIPELKGLNLEPYRKKGSEYWQITCAKEVFEGV